MGKWCDGGEEGWRQAGRLLVVLLGAEGGVEAVEVGDDFLGLELFALCAAFLDEFVAELGRIDDALKLLCYLVRLVGCGIEGCVATRLRHRGGIGRNHRHIAAHRLENRDAETLEFRDIDTGYGIGILS